MTMTIDRRRWFRLREAAERAARQRELDRDLARYRALCRTGVEAAERYPAGGYDSDCYPDRDDG